MLKKRFKDELQGYAVLRGFPDDFKNFAARYKKDSVSGGKIKFHPPMYKFYGLKKVPAYVLADCSRNFKFRSCENHMLVKGDISFRVAMQLFSEERKDLMPYYQYLIDAK